MNINGIEGKSRTQIELELKHGGRFVVYLWVVSLLVITWKRPSAIHYIAPGQSRVAPGLVFSAVSFLFGWWGIPWGIFYTFEALAENFSGGKDVTAEVKSALLL
jgi:hypothetical protein